jgi:hypothetical protein
MGIKSFGRKFKNTGRLIKTGGRSKVRDKMKQDRKKAKASAAARTTRDAARQKKMNADRAKRAKAVRRRTGGRTLLFRSRPRPRPRPRAR